MFFRCVFSQNCLQGLVKLIHKDIQIIWRRFENERYSLFAVSGLVVLKLISNTILMWSEIRSLASTFWTVGLSFRLIMRSTVWPEVCVGPFKFTCRLKPSKSSWKREITGRCAWSICWLKSLVIMISALCWFISSNNCEKVSKDLAKDPDGGLYTTTKCSGVGLYWNVCSQY